MCKFKQLNNIDDLAINLHYIPLLKGCYEKYIKYFQDDFAKTNSENFITFLLNLSPYFWIVTDYNDKFMGFVFLDNFTGDRTSLYSAELTTGFDKSAWGIFTRYSARIFLKKCFDELGLYKIKAQIYPDNHRSKTLMKNCGFIYESTLKNETLRFGKPQDIEVYALYRDYYYKTR